MRVLFPILLLAIGCSPTPSQPVPVAGTSADLGALAGQWTGSYEASDGGRSGSIVFRLEAGRDTAYGDVVMVPVAWAGGQTGGRESGRVPDVAPPRALTIRFVRVAGDQVTGQLDPYRDPECGCQLRTVFQGRLRGRTLKGSYTSYHQESGNVVTGRWQVERAPAP